MEIFSMQADEGNQSARYRRVNPSWPGTWVEIVNVANEKDRHHVKWYGGTESGELYVSDQGVGFVLLKE